MLRIIQNTPLRTPLCNCTKISTLLPIRELHQFQLLCLVHKFYYNNDQLPIIFSNFFTLNTEIHSHNTRSLNNLHLPSINNSCGTRFSVSLTGKPRRHFMTPPHNISSHVLYSNGSHLHVEYTQLRIIIGLIIASEVRTMQLHYLHRYLQSSSKSANIGRRAVSVSTVPGSPLCLLIESSRCCVASAADVEENRADCSIAG